jgi:3-oxoacyl-(acyl-carrier-protein) synthase
VLAGGFEALSPYVIAGFNALRLVSKRSCRPFDRDRDGLNPGEGAAMFVVESRESALRRGAVGYAAVRGFGAALDAYHYTRAHPQGRGLARAMRCALEQGGLGPRDIDLLHLHGTATEANDPSEYAACREVFGDALQSVDACSTKPMTGHTFGASAALGMVLATVAAGESVVPATLNCERVDERFEGLRIGNVPKPRRIRHAMVTALGFGGEAFAVLLRFGSS